MPPNPARTRHLRSQAVTVAPETAKWPLTCRDSRFSSVNKAWAATASKVMAVPVVTVVGRRVRRELRVRRSWHVRSVHELVESFDQAAVAGGFLAPAAGVGVGGQRGGIGMGRKVDSVRKLGQCS